VSLQSWKEKDLLLNIRKRGLSSRVAVMIGSIRARVTRPRRADFGIVRKLFRSAKVRQAEMASCPEPAGTVVGDENTAAVELPRVFTSYVLPREERSRRQRSLRVELRIERRAPGHTTHKSRCESSDDVVCARA